MDPLVQKAKRLLLLIYFLRILKLKQEYLIIIKWYALIGKYFYEKKNKFMHHRCFKNFNKVFFEEKLPEMLRKIGSSFEEFYNICSCSLDCFAESAKWSAFKFLKFPSVSSAQMLKCPSSAQVSQAFSSAQVLKYLSDLSPQYPLSVSQVFKGS